MTTYADIKAKGTQYDAMIRDAATANGVSYDYLHKKIFNESSFNPNAVSPTGPRGLGQFTKATGRAYGLVTDEDFFDPAKSINAAAQFTRDLLGTYKGDYLKTSLAYNQGQGPLGRPQLAALDRGDFSKISEEGKKYMANLLDVAGDSPSRKWFDQPDAPKQLADFDKATQGVSKKPQVQRGDFNAPSSFDLAEGQIPEVQQTFQERELRQNGPAKGTFDGTWDAVKSSLSTSVPAQILRNVTVEEHDPLDWVKPADTSNWSDEDFENIRKEGVDPQYFGFLFDFTRGDRNKLADGIALAKENAEHDRRIGKAGFGGQLVAGVAGAALDPLTYVPVPGTAGATFAARVGKQAAFSSVNSVASEGLRSQATGIEGHYTAAAVGGFVIGGAAAAALDKVIYKSASQAARPEMADGDLESVLARHGEAALPNREVPLDEAMMPSAKPQKADDEMDDDYLEKILGLHGERSHKQEGLKAMSDDSVESILARHQESSEPNEFVGPSIRMEAREAARMSGQDDPTRMQWNEGETIDSHAGVDFTDVPGEPGSVRLRDGSIISKGNPLNPRTLKLAASLEPERSARGISLSDITEIGYTLNRSEDPEVLVIGSKLFRSTVQTESGSNGRFGATASDIIERLRGEDHMNYGKLNDLTDNLLSKDPRYVGASGSRQALSEKAYRRIAEAIEDQSGVKVGQLSAQEKDLMKLINDHFKRKQDALENPAQFGNPDASSILDSTRHAGHYVPNVYDDAAKVLHLQKFGGADGLQAAIKESWLASYASRPHVKARVDKMIKEMLEKDAPKAVNKAKPKSDYDQALEPVGVDEFGRKEFQYREDAGGGKEASINAVHHGDSDLRIVWASNGHLGGKRPDGSGKGLVTDMYKALIDDAEHMGRKLTSDASVSPSAQKVWDRLKAAGHNIEINPKAVKDSEGYYKTPDDSPVYRLIPEAKIKSSNIEAGQVGITPEAIKAAVEKYAHDKAYGIAHESDFNRSSLIDDGLDSLVGAENNNFLEARNLFDSDVSVPLSDGSTFAVNDLRVYDFQKLMPSYDRRINGDIGIMAATGEGTDALKAKILGLKTKQGNTKEITALEDAVKLLTGRSRRNPDGAFGTFLRGLNDLSFFTKNAYMAAQNFTEVAGMVTNGHIRMLMHGVPFLREMTTWGTKIKPEQLKEMHGLIFGKELDDTIRPHRADIVDRLRATGASPAMSQVIGSFKYGTQELAARSPLTKLLTETTNYIIEAGRQGALVDLVRAAYGETPKILTAKRLHALSITPGQLGAMKQAMREHLVSDGMGFKIKDPAAMRSDPRVMDIWRLGDKIADESILRPHKLSSQDTVALGAGWHMALQFKKFVFRSLNARMMRAFYDTTKNGRALDVALQGVISTGLATGFYVAQRYVQAQGMPQENRKEFLANSFQPEMLGWAAASRSSMFGSPIGAANFALAPLGFDPAAAVRTSILPRGPEFKKRDHPVRYNPLRSDGVQAPMSRLLEQVPGAGLIGSVYQVGANSAGLWDNPRGSQELGYMTGLYNGLRGLVPNDPVSQKALSTLMQSQGMEYRQR